jgi:hypothetical protein
MRGRSGSRDRSGSVRAAGGGEHGVRPYNIGVGVNSSCVTSPRALHDARMGVTFALRVSRGNPGSNRAAGAGGHETRPYEARVFVGGTLMVVLRGSRDGAGSNCGSGAGITPRIDACLAPTRFSRGETMVSGVAV